MTPKARKYLLDIIDAIELIEEFIKPLGSFESYEKNQLIKSAIERQLMIVGEAVNQFRNRVDEQTISHTREIVQFRNVLVHAYGYVNDREVWSIIEDDLPILKKEVSQLLPS